LLQKILIKFLNFRKNLELEQFMLTVMITQKGVLLLEDLKIQASEKIWEIKDFKVI